jgi:dipeptide/tripeptide permease
MKHPPDPEDADTRPSTLKNTAGYIIVTEFCERLAYYGFAGSLVLFFQVSNNCDTPRFFNLDQ